MHDGPTCLHKCLKLNLQSCNFDGNRFFAAFCTYFQIPMMTCFGWVTYLTCAGTAIDHQSREYHPKSLLEVLCADVKAVD